MDVRAANSEATFPCPYIHKLSNFFWILLILLVKTCSVCAGHKLKQELRKTPTSVHLYCSASGKLHVAVVKVNMTVLLWLPLLPCFNLSFCLFPIFVSLSSSSSSSSVYCPIFSFLLPPALLCRPSDDCWWHLCSVSQMSRNRNWNINLTVNMSEEWWGGESVSVLLFSKAL